MYVAIHKVLIISIVLIYLGLICSKRINYLSLLMEYIINQYIIIAFLFDSKFLIISDFALAVIIAMDFLVLFNFKKYVVVYDSNCEVQKEYIETYILANFRKPNYVIQLCENYLVIKNVQLSEVREILKNINKYLRYTDDKWLDIRHRLYSIKFSLLLLVLLLIKYLISILS